MERSERVVLTPEIARNWLDSSAGNRPLSQRKIKEFSRLMSLGKFKDLSPFYFDMDGRLQDGHHRCNAIIFSDRSFPVWKIQTKLEQQDFGSKTSNWTLSDLLSRDGVGNAKNKIAVATAYIRLTKNIWQFSFSYDEVRRCIERVPKIWSNEAGERGIKCSRIFYPGTMGALYAWASEKNDELADQFFDFFETGMSVPFNQALLFRERMLRRDKMNAGIASMKTASALFVVAFNAARKGRNLQILKWSPDGQFPSID